MENTEDHDSRWVSIGFACFCGICYVSIYGVPSLRDLLNFYFQSCYLCLSLSIHPRIYASVFKAHRPREGARHPKTRKWTEMKKRPERKQNMRKQENICKKHRLGKT